MTHGTEDWTGLSALLNTDREFLALAVGADVEFGLASKSGAGVVLRVRDGAVELGAEPAFTVQLDPDSWAALLDEHPVPGTQHVLVHLTPRGDGHALGDPLAFAQHLHLVRRAVEVLGDSTSDHRTIPPPSLSDVGGRYVRVNVAPWGTCDIYVESAGNGRPVVMLHTAGADSTQYHGILGRAEHFPGRQLIAFDLPWHGRSSPAAGKGPHDYTLTSESYAGCVEAVISALELSEPPIVVGVSMAGAAVIEVAARYPDAIAGAIACQAGPRVGDRQSEWLRNPRVNQALFVPEWTFGLMSPHSPKADRDRVWWGYSRGGYGIYERDISYYTTCWDIDNVRHLLGELTPPIVLMSGAYDYSVPPTATQELAAEIPGAIYRVMPELGHFPHAENPSAFAEHLAWALRVIDAAGGH